jgi:CDGSH-type Zn-finger protein
MARMVLHEAKGSMKIEINGQVKSFCMCGLSKNLPFCDASHKMTLDEEEGKTYKYHPDGTREQL